MPHWTKSGENLVFKKYFNIGFAADTPNGLVVPVIPNADQLSIYDTARALASLSEKGACRKTEGHGNARRQFYDFEFGRYRRHVLSHPSSTHLRSRSWVYPGPRKSRCTSVARLYRG